MSELKVVRMDGIWFVEHRGIRWSLRDVLGVAEWERFPIGVSTRLDEAFESAHSCPRCAKGDALAEAVEEYFAALKNLPEEIEVPPSPEAGVYFMKRVILVRRLAAYRGKG